MALLSTALMCLALNVYKEARGEPFVGKTAVAHVTLNRTKERNKTVCQVVLEPKQFSWTINQVKRGKLVKGAEPDLKSKEWKESLQAAQVTLRTRDHTKGATFYHEYRINPSWAKSFKFVARWGNHIFYKRVA